MTQNLASQKKVFGRPVQTQNLYLVAIGVWFWSVDMTLLRLIVDSIKCPKGHPDARYVGNATSGKRMYACHHPDCKRWFIEGETWKEPVKEVKPTKPKRKGKK